MQGTSVTGFVVLLLFLDQYFMINEEVPTGVRTTIRYFLKCSLCLELSVSSVSLSPFSHWACVLHHTHAHANESYAKEQTKQKSKQSETERQ